MGAPKIGDRRNPTPEHFDYYLKPEHRLFGDVTSAFNRRRQGGDYTGVYVVPFVEPPFHSDSFQDKPRGWASRSFKCYRALAYGMLGLPEPDADDSGHRNFWFGKVAEMAYQYELETVRKNYAHNILGMNTELGFRLPAEWYWPEGVERKLFWLDVTGRLDCVILWRDHPVIGGLVLEVIDFKTTNHVGYSKMVETDQTKSTSNANLSHLTQAASGALAIYHQGYFIDKRLDGTEVKVEVPRDVKLFSRICLQTNGSIPKWSQAAESDHGCFEYGTEVPLTFSNEDVEGVPFERLPLSVHVASGMNQLNNIYKGVQGGVLPPRVLPEKRVEIKRFQKNNGYGVDSDSVAHWNCGYCAFNEECQEDLADGNDSTEKYLKKEKG